MHFDIYAKNNKIGREERREKKIQINNIVLLCGVECSNGNYRVFER